MVYARRRTLEWIPTEMEAPQEVIPPAEAGEIVLLKAAPMMWEGNGDFQIGRRSQAGGWGFWGGPQSKVDENTINIKDMTPEQLAEAARTLVYRLKGNAIGQQQWKMMLDIVNRSDTVEAFWDGVNAEPYLNLEEVPFYNGLLGDEFNTIALITAKINRMLSRVNQDIDAVKVAQTMIADLNGPAPVTPVKESTVPSEIDGIKQRVGELEREVPKKYTRYYHSDLSRFTEGADMWHALARSPNMQVVLENGWIKDIWDSQTKKTYDILGHVTGTRETPYEEPLCPQPATEESPEHWPKDVPTKPTLPDLPLEWDPADIQAYLTAMHTYLTNQQAYTDNLESNMSWSLWMTRLCLKELEASRASGSQTDNYQRAFELLDEIIAKLEDGGVLYD